MTTTLLLPATASRTKHERRMILWALAKAGNNVKGNSPRQYDTNCHYPVIYLPAPIQPISDDPFESDEADIVATYDGAYCSIRVLIGRLLPQSTQNALFTRIGTIGSHIARCTVNLSTNANNTVLVITPNKTIQAREIDTLKALAVSVVRGFIIELDNTPVAIQTSLF